MDTSPSFISRTVNCGGSRSTVAPRTQTDIEYPKRAITINDKSDDCVKSPRKLGRDVIPGRGAFRRGRGLMIWLAGWSSVDGNRFRTVQDFINRPSTLISLKPFGLICYRAGRSAVNLRAVSRVGELVHVATAQQGNRLFVAFHGGWETCLLTIRIIRACHWEYSRFSNEIAKTFILGKFRDETSFFQYSFRYCGKLTW